MVYREKLLTKNNWSRPVRDYDMKQIKGIVLHWIAAPKQTPEHVYNWFEGRKNGKNGFGSAHYCVGLDGEVWQYIPQSEMAYHVGSETYTEEALKRLGTYPNNSTLGIEMCHTSWEGEFTKDTWEETKLLSALLLMEYNLEISDLTTHKKVVGWKECPRWFHLFPAELDRFKEETYTIMEGGVKGKVNATWGLNVRNDVMGAKVGWLKNGQEVDINGFKDGWFRVITDDFQGYASSKYINVFTK
jgi:N-acetylmuramoyl-L-alanine amidase